MIDGLRPYAEMKPTGLPWLGEVPAHWDVRRNGRLFSARRETNFPKLPILEVSIRTGVRIRDFDNGGRKQEMTDRSKYQRAVKGDIAYNMMRMWQGAVGIAPADGLVSPAYVVARPFAETDTAFYSYLFRTAAYMREIDVFSRGIVPDRNRLYWESFKQMPSVYPPLEEQRLIVRFLNWHGGQVAQLVRAKKKLIALLNEQKQAIIHRAVTRGLDPDAKLKPSGIDWLGDVPEGWELRRLGDTNKDVVNGLWGNEPDGLSDLACIRVADFDRRSLSVSLENPTFRSITLKERTRRKLKKGDLLIEKSGGGDQQPVGAVVSYDHEAEAICSNFVSLLQISPSCDSRYVKFLHSALYSIRLIVRSIKQTTGIQNLSARSYFSESIVLPPMEQQRSIAEFLEASLVNFEAAIDLANREIVLIQEFRTRIIADVVTGKLDVRAIAASLPETDEYEVADDLSEDDEIDDMADDTEDEEAAA